MKSEFSGPLDVALWGLLCCEPCVVGVFLVFLGCFCVLVVMGVFMLLFFSLFECFLVSLRGAFV